MSDNDQISIKVTIADRIFPLKVSVEEEENIRKAAELINKKVTTYSEQYSIRDKQAALSMSALEIAAELLAIDMQSQLEKDSLLNELLNIDTLLSNET